MRKAHPKWWSSDECNLAPEYEREFPQPHPSNVPPKRIMYPVRPTELLFNQRLFYMIIVIIRQCSAHHLFLWQGRTLKRRQSSLPFRGIWKKVSSTAFWGLSPNQKRTSNQLSKSPPLLDSAQRLHEQTGLLITAWSGALITNSVKICINICILGSHLSHKEKEKMFTLHTSWHSDLLHPFGDKIPGKHPISQANKNVRNKWWKFGEIFFFYYLVRFLNKYCVGIGI